MKFSLFKKQRQTPKKPIRKIVVSINPLVIKDLKPKIRSLRSESGFTLVELMVSVAITGILMVGISTFFSSTFSAMFRAQNRAGSTARQFAVNEIVRDKFTTLKTLVDSGTDWMLSINK
ncbi:prepilin-type N-terminal cleavage/methylation domain-containing protein, partial [Candidatus Pacearchaeota archaeon]|nr:prepilin-type N-terminal cleavage/methylation domain-containing protein [Candidatus Pacearchaeota archaeon]